MGINFQHSFLRISILIINLTLYYSSFLPIGLNQLNNFIYLERLKDLTLQTLSQECSFSKGPNCYFAENIRSEIFEQKNIEEEKTDNNNNSDNNNDEDITIINYKKEWMDLYTNSRKIGFLNSFTELNEYLTLYKNYISSNSDTTQIPHPLTLRLSLTFESYDDMTIKGDMYAYASKPVHFLTETIYIDIVGKLRMHYGEDLNLKDQSKYPCKTFGIIESNSLTIKLGGKQFICEYFYLRLRDIKIRNINVNGYLGNIKAFSMNRDINYMVDKGWIKIDLPSTKVDRIILPGGIDVDNFKFTIETIQQYDIAVHFHNNYVRNIEELIKDDDI